MKRRDVLGVSMHAPRQRASFGNDASKVGLYPCAIIGFVVSPSVKKVSYA